MNPPQKQTYQIKRMGEAIPELIINLVQLVIRLLNKLVMPLFWARVGVETKTAVEKINRPLLIIANHKSYYDPLLIADSLPIFSRAYPLRFITKDQVFVNPVSNLVFRMMGSFPTYYGSGLDKSLQTPQEILKQGGTVVFFPEGKCIREERLGEGKMGVGTLALSVPDIQILPIAIRGSYKIGRLGFFARPEVEVLVGESFLLKDKVDLNNTNPQQVSDLFMNEIKSLYEQLD